MASLIDELVDILEAENSEYISLIALSTEKTTAIVKNNIEDLQSITAKEQDIVDRVNTLEKKREDTVLDICKILNLKPGELTVKDLIDILAKKPTEQKKLADVHGKLKRTLQRMTHINESNKSLMKESMEILEFEMNLLKGLKMAPETNNYTRGAYSAGGTEYGAGAFDAKQ